MRTLTFLFADLRDYTAFVERHGDVAATTLIADYRRLVRGEVTKAKGAEIKTEGDSFYVVFEAASDAVRCGVSILREAERYSRDRPDRPMRVGAGIHAGEPQPHEGQYVGGAVIVAARLAQSATAGELLVSEVVRSLLPKGTAPAMRERQGLNLKGIGDAPRAFTVGWAVPEPPPTEPRVVSVEAVAPPDRSILCPRVIGRETELAALRTLLDEAVSGRGRTVLVAGEAGVGKSAVLRTFLELASAAGARVLRGECTEVEARKPFGPFIDAFIAGSLPLPAELSQGAPGAMPVAEVERYRVHGAFAQALAELAGNSTVVVAIEDVHWADSATLELLPYLARKLRERRVLLLCTYRDDELHRLHPLRGTLAELKRLRLVTEIRLPRLGPDAVAAMIKETLRLGRAPTTAFREAIHERCEGNPFFIEEVLRTLVERGDLEYRDGSWRRTKEVAELTIPDSVRDAVQQRLATVTPTARRALQVAAVIGQRFAFDLLQRVADIREGELLDALREAMEAQIVVEDESGEEDSYRFRHALTRESVLAELMRRERRLLHIEVAEAIERAARDPERVAEELAYHFDAGGDEERAFRYHEIAGRQAERAGSFGGLVEHLERAIELAPDGADIGSLQLRLASGLMWSLDMTKALRAAEAARASFRAAGQTAREGEALAEVGWL
ncbi:MAG TPA: AAA family ATPase, partial [Candidatus Limnocylindrales bacterium]|nr:AAA family ATPase [Candidatus Limnocylindrales bacterium]